MGMAEGQAAQTVTILFVWCKLNKHFNAETDTVEKVLTCSNSDIV